ncbi:MAG: hypothetical protein U9N86_07835 [Bacteroidota bacterium]|nr:hypothetical protein [Bacteroidota bacterium]
MTNIKKEKTGKTTQTKKTRKTKQVRKPKQATTKDKETNRELLGKIFDNVKENIVDGSKVIQKESAAVLGKVKEKSSEAYDAGTGAVETITGKVQDYSIQQKLQKEQSKLEQRKEDLLKQFGEITYKEYAKNGVISKRLLTTKKVDALVVEIKAITTRQNEINKSLS